MGGNDLSRKDRFFDIGDRNDGLHPTTKGLYDMAYFIHDFLMDSETIKNAIKK